MWLLKTNQHLLIWLLILSATPSMAQVANFAPLNLALGFNKKNAVVTGRTGGTYSLSSIANKDRYNKPCIGYGDPNPDHIMVLQNDFPALKLEVKSKGKENTLLIRGPQKNLIRCNFSSDNQPRASIEDKNWPAGTYEIWVGSMEVGQNNEYRLFAEQ